MHLRETVLWGRISRSPYSRSQEPVDGQLIFPLQFHDWGDRTHCPAQVGLAHIRVSKEGSKRDICVYRYAWRFMWTSQSKAYLGILYRQIVFAHSSLPNIEPKVWTLQRNKFIDLCHNLERVHDEPA
jgi:hypothetical protein